MPGPIQFKRSCQLALAALLLLVAGGCHGVPGDDARALTRLLESLPRTHSDEQRARLLLDGCARIPSCAGGCRDELAEAAAPRTARVSWGDLLAPCRRDWRAARAQGQLFDAWFNWYLAGYTDRATLALPPDEQSGLEAARARLGLE